MKLKNCLIVVVIAFLAVYFGAVIVMFVGEIYSSTIAITTFSEYEHQIETKFLDTTLPDEPNVVMLSSQDLEGYPIVTELITLADKREPPRNKAGYLHLTFDELKSIIEELAKKLAQQKGGQPSDYIRINDDEGDGVYYYKFETEFFYVDEQLYNIQDLYAIEDFEKIKFKVRTAEENYWIRDFVKVHLTSDELSSIPKLQEAIEEIGKYHEDVQESRAVVESEYLKYYDWAVSMKIVDPNDYEYTRNTYIQFDDNLYRLSFHEKR